MTTPEDHPQKTADEDFHRVLAVIAEHAEQAEQIAAQFAEQGELVEAVWYPDSRRLLAEKETSRFQAVILFPTTDGAADANELAVRNALVGMPLYRVA